MGEEYVLSFKNVRI